MLKRRLLRTVWVFLLLGAIHSSIYGKIVVNPPSNSKIFVIVNFDYFMCNQCMESFLSFYNAFRMNFASVNVSGILSYQYDPQKMNDEETYYKIVLKKWNGFARSADIQWPFYIDKYHIFRGMSKKGASVVLFENELKTIKSFDLPLSLENQRELQRIMNIENNKDLLGRKSKSS